MPRRRRTDASCNSLIVKFERVSIWVFTAFGAIAVLIPMLASKREMIAWQPTWVEPLGQLPFVPPGLPSREKVTSERGAAEAVVPSGSSLVAIPNAGEQKDWTDRQSVSPLPGLMTHLTLPEIATRSVPIHLPQTDSSVLTPTPPAVVANLDTKHNGKMIASTTIIGRESGGRYRDNSRRLSVNQPVTILDDTDRWVQVEWNDGGKRQVGWVESTVVQKLH